MKFLLNEPQREHNKCLAKWLSNAQGNRTNEKATRIVQQYTLLSTEQIMGIVAMETNTTIIDLKKRTREREIVIPRHICI